MIDDEKRGVGPSARFRRLLRMLLRAAAPALSIVGLVVLWDIGVRVADVPAFVLPSPGSVLIELWDDPGDLYLKHAASTLQAVLLGFAVAVVVGATIGLAMASWRWSYRILYPPIVGLQASPQVALAPLLLIWFGFGLTSRVIIVALIAFFPVVIATYHGLSSVPPELLRLGRSIGFSGPALLWKIRLPAALPEMFSGFKIGIGLALIGAIVAEFLAPISGLGYLLVLSTASGTAVVMAILFLLAILGILLYTAVDLIEKVVVPWHIATGRERPIIQRG